MELTKTSSLSTNENAIKAHKPHRKSKKRSKKQPDKVFKAVQKDDKRPNIFRDAYGFLAGLYEHASPSPKEETHEEKLEPIATFEVQNETLDENGNIISSSSPVVADEKLQDSEVCITVTGCESLFLDESPPLTTTRTIVEPEIIHKPIVEKPIEEEKAANFPILKRPSALIRKNSSGMNEILDNSAPKDFCPENTGKTHIRNSYEGPKRQPPPALRLSNIFHTRMQEGFNQGNPPRRVLSRSFFDSVHEQVRRIKSKTSAAINTAESFTPEDESSTPSLFASKKQSLMNINASSAAQGFSDSTGNVNINLTLQLNGVDGKTGTITKELGDVTQNQTVVIDARPLNAKAETSMQTDTESQILKASEEENTIVTNTKGTSVDACISMTQMSAITQTDFNNNNIVVESSAEKKEKENMKIVQHKKECASLKSPWSKLVNCTGESIMNVCNIMANIIPVESVTIPLEEMDADEDKIGISLMRLLGIPRQVRHRIYQEAIGEMEVLYDVTTGTFSALGTVMKWAIGGKTAREEILHKTRAICAMNSEVDMNSDAWVNLTQSVCQFTEMVSEMTEITNQEDLPTSNKLLEELE